MKRKRLNQIVSEFSDVNSIQKIEDKLIENYPYLDKIDINEVIIAILKNN